MYFNVVDCYAVEVVLICYVVYTVAEALVLLVEVFDCWLGHFDGMLLI